MDSSQNERRRFGRREVCKPGSIRLPTGECSRCLVVNISEGGALLKPLKALELPDIFDLVIQADDIIVTCRVAHQTGGKIGVEYVSLPRRASRVLTDASRELRVSLLRTRFSESS